MQKSYEKKNERFDKKYLANIRTLELLIDAISFECLEVHVFVVWHNITKVMQKNKKNTEMLVNAIITVHPSIEMYTKIWIYLFCEPLSSKGYQRICFFGIICSSMNFFFIRWYRFYIYDENSVLLLERLWRGKKNTPTTNIICIIDCKHVYGFDEMWLDFISNM